MSSTLALIFIGVAVLFILGIKFLSSPKTARYGNLLAAAGMVVAFFATIPLMQLHEWNLNCTLMAVGIVIGLVIGAIGAYSVKMTAMPQMVAAFNGLGGGSAALVASLEFLRRSHSLEGVTVSAAVPMLFATLIGSLVVFRQYYRVFETGGEIREAAHVSRPELFERPRAARDSRLVRILD